MKILAVDTSAEVAAIAVMEDDKLLGEYSINHKKTHSQKLLPMINDMLKNLEIDPKSFDYYAAANGPGSFTGLRIGVTTIKTMAFVAGKPVIAVPTLDGLANNISYTESLICPIMDARNRQVFTALYSYNGEKLNKITEYLGITVEELADLIKGKNRKVIFLGDAVTIYKDFFKEQLQESCEFAKPSLNLHRASSLAEIAIQMVHEGRAESCFEMLPNYLRKSQAERTLDIKNSIEG